MNVNECYAYCRRALFVVLVVAACAAAAGNDDPRPGPVVIDTDMGLDDVVGLAIALQDPQLEISALVAGAGAMSAADATSYAERMLYYFNRSDVALYAPSSRGEARAPAERFVRPALPNEVPPSHQLFSPAAYTSALGPTTVLALGPLTNLAAALDASPEVKDQIKHVILPGVPDVEHNWNLRADPAAYAAVRAAGVPLYFVAGDANAAKPRSWQIGTDDFGPGTALGELLVRKLLAKEETRRHYLEALSELTDELVVLYATQPTYFLRAAGLDDVFTVRDQTALLNLLHDKLVEGRQARGRVVLVSGPLPDAVFQPEIRAMRHRIVAKNGETEWFAQLLMNELHQHAGAWSIVGVKMGLRAAELLNAPQHGMEIVSRTELSQPLSCLNDGLIVATGSTPGRLLFTADPTPPQPDARATFTYNGRSITLRLRSEYQAQINRGIADLLQEHTLEDEDYWLGVEKLSYEIWENWHRRDIFEFTEPPASSSEDRQQR